MPSMTRRLFVASLALALGACTRAQTTPREAPKSYVRVVNQAFLDANIYALVSSQRVRLGTATGNSTTRFLIPPSLLFGPTQIQFQSDPIGGRTSPVSMAVTVSPGDEVTMTIPPQ